MRKYRLKQDSVDVWQFKADETFPDFIQGLVNSNTLFLIPRYGFYNESDVVALLDTPEYGLESVSLGDYIVKVGQDELHAYKPKEFKKLYERVD